MVKCHQNYYQNEPTGTTNGTEARDYTSVMQRELEEPAGSLSKDSAVLCKR